MERWQLMNICKNCKHFNLIGNAIWYNAFCHHPENEKVLTVDPVFGTSSYQGKNDLGTVYYSNDKFDNCRKFNSDGHCTQFEEER